MSITSDLRTYAEQGRTQLTEVTDEVSHRVSDVSAKATAALGDLRAQAEKAINLDAIKSAVEPYLNQAKGYRDSVTDRASGLVNNVTADKRVAKVVETAEQVSGAVVGTVAQRVVKPVQHLTGLGSSSSSSSSSKAKPARKPAARKTTKPASTRPAAKTSTTKASTTTSTARKSPAKKASPSA